MKIPDVNEAATDHDRELTREIVDTLGGVVDSPTEACFEDGPVQLANGSFTLDQVMAMLGKLGVLYDQEMACYFSQETGFVYPVEGAENDGSYVREIPTEPHNLTAALEALLAALEERGESK